MSEVIDNVLYVIVHDSEQVEKLESMMPIDRGEEKRRKKQERRGEEKRELQCEINLVNKPV